MTPEEMHQATATFIEAHRVYQAELAERIARVEKELGLQPQWLRDKIERYREVHLGVKVPE